MKKPSPKPTTHKRVSHHPETQKTPERLQKLLADAGLGSRRQIEGWIQAKRLSVNGKIAALGVKATLNDLIRLDGKRLYLSAQAKKIRQVIMYHKPVGEICTRHDPEGRPTVFDNLPKLRQGRWISIGRLDINTSGLLLLTNDGALANRLMHPRYEVEREYAVRIMGTLTPEMIVALKKGVTLEDGIARFTAIEKSGGENKNIWYKVVLKEGRNREVRRLFESQGLTVSRLIRTRFGHCQLPPWLRRGKWESVDVEKVIV